MGDAMDCRYSRGFTLIELLVVLVIGAILLLLAIPNFSGLIRTSHLTTQSHSFITAAHFARNEAVRRNEHVLICARFLQECAAVADWENGWLVFVDNGNNNVDEGEVIRVFDALSEGYSLQPNVAATWLKYSPDGSVRRGGGSGGLPLMTFRLCAPDVKVGEFKERSREIVINATGRMRLQFGREGITKCP